MAEEVPISDVLCEAMEYLSKLGSNLRQRSDTLKQKRIRKDKLRNSHAVKKAANKVLLICELSKKSLENVETGVKRVLDLVGAAQKTSDDGGRSSSRKSSVGSTSEIKPAFHYFEYDKKRLRVAKKISVSHFTSVKVVARKMAKSMQDKYPVYYDCKLYRIRKRLLIAEKLERKKEKEEDEKNECSNKEKNSIEKDKIEKQPSQSNSPRPIDISVIDIESDCANTDTESRGSIENKKVKDKNKKKRNPSLYVSSESDTEVLSQKHSKEGNEKSKSGDKVISHKSMKTPEKVEKLKREREKEVDEKNECTNKKKISIEKDEIEKQPSRSNSPRPIDISVIDIESDSANTDTESRESIEKKKVKDRNKKQKKASLYVSSESETEVLSLEHTKEGNEKSKSSDNVISHKSMEMPETLEGTNVANKDDLSCSHSDTDNFTKSKSSLNNEDNNEKKVKEEKSPKKTSKNKRARIIDDSESDSKEECQKVTIDKEKDELSDASGCNNDKNSENNETKSTKPLLKLVNINKLLKPGLAKEDESNSKPRDESKKKCFESSDTRRKQKSKKQYSVERKKYSSSDSDDEAFWQEKRKEVKAFKAKVFTINISRLPDISDKLLYKYNLTKITKNCATICEITSHRNEDKTNPIKESVSDVATVKNALLQDSDSDKSDCNKKSDTVETESSGELESYDRNTVETSKTQNSAAEELAITDASNQSTRKNSNSNTENDGNALSSKDKQIKENESVDVAITDASSQSTRKNSNSNTENDRDELSGEDKQIKENESVDDINIKSNEIKSSLLNDSSSSDVDKTCSKKRKTDNKSGSGTNHPEKEQHSLNDEKAALLQDTPDRNTRKDKSVSPDEDPNAIKSALLNDSSSDGQKSPNTANNVKSTPQSKRKHIMESMHAKKMLLTYSSSSETEDENLSRVLKAIKDELLKGISSGEDEDVKIRGRKKLFSSDSDENIASRAKKKRKLRLKKKLPNKKNNSSDEDTKSQDITQDDTNSKKSDSSTKKMGRSGDSGSSSDTQEDKVIDGLTNLNNLAKTRRRVDSSDTQGTEETSSSRSARRKLKMAKTPLITGEGLLEAPLSSEEDAASAAESEVNDEDLPAIPVMSLNGGDLQDHLAKDDLLGDSDSSKSSEEKKEDDSDEEEENTKKKRRKANTISSGSEAGSSRRKQRDNDVRLSDFEDSEDESSETGKKKTKSKRKKVSDSDASGGSSNEGKKKRRRIKQIDESDDVSGSESETEGRNKHGRKNIRKVMGKSQLEEATKKAAREEKERVARIAERQKMYNNVLFDETGKPDEVVVDKVVLDFDPDTKEPLIEVDRGLVKKLKPHQANGIKFMWDACFESVKRIKKDRGSGCILAHCMGLGKTLQVVSLTHTLLTHSKLTGVNRVLVVCPLSTVLNWVNEFRMWLEHAESDYDLDIYELSKFKQNSERAFQLSQWLSGGGVCVLGYEMFRNLSADNPKKFKKKLLSKLQESLVDPGADLVVCDEGHLLKNEKTSLSQSMNRIKTRRRIVLTGTPLQNNLKEYYCMVQFVKPNLLGKYNEYLNRFVNPITNGQYTDSTDYDIRIMKRRSHVLHKMLDGAVQRRDYGVLAPFLPPKHEYVLFITLTDIQIKLYQHYLENYSRRPFAGKTSGFLFPDFQSLQRIWTHPLVLKYNSERYEIMQQKKRDREEEEDSEGSLVDFIDDDSTPDESSSADSSDDLSDLSDDSRKKSKKKKNAKKAKKDSKATSRRATRANPANQEEEELKLEDVLQPKNENPTEWWIPLVTDDEIEDMRNSPKLVLLFDILRQCEAIGDKLLVFSQSLYSLDLIEHFLGKVDEATQEGRIDEKLCGHVGSWSPGVDYFRLDGSTSCENRSIWCKNFNREDNPRARLFLISTRAGGLGINLVAANRVVIFDVSWNPSHDVQSIFRVYRFGQKKPCYVYRFLAMGTMEEKIYERQVTKQAISKRVIDEQQIDRHYAENDLAELYKFEPRPTEPRPIPTLPKDRLFAEMLKDHETLIYKFHEHDSLLENKEEETLTEEERKAAWEDFENEKNRPPPVPFNAWPQHNGLMGNLLVQQQQQQQLAYAALATVLRKDMPSLSEDQIRSMLPLIYSQNPALMQKMNEMYKYPQASMMNPAMMNSMMNPGAGMGGGGTSGLQYEPPWARDLQQQNQMRLQQLVQQQNAMGAKYYAGGLGSRDPVAMALQQQRAREMLVPSSAGRPRGRPPLQPRQGTLPATSDVVNLDSD